MLGDFVSLPRYLWMRGTVPVNDRMTSMNGEAFDKSDMKEEKKENR